MAGIFTELFRTMECQVCKATCHCHSKECLKKCEGLNLLKWKIDPTKKVGTVVCRNGNDCSVCVCRNFNDKAHQDFVKMKEKEHDKNLANCLYDGMNVGYDANGDPVLVGCFTIYRIFRDFAHKQYSRSMVENFIYDKRTTPISERVKKIQLITAYGPDLKAEAEKLIKSYKMANPTK